MSISNRTILVFISFFFLFAAHQLAAQQQAPYGSCMIIGGDYDGQWCWPLVPGSFGEACICPSPDGDQNGIIQ